MIKNWLLLGLKSSRDLANVALSYELITNDFGLSKSMILAFCSSKKRNSQQGSRTIEECYIKNVYVIVLCHDGFALTVTA